MDHLTLLRAHNGKRMAKRLTIGGNNAIDMVSYDKATWFSAEAVPVAGIRDIADLLRRLENRRDACAIRGEPLPGTDLSRLRRKKEEHGGVFAERPRRWMMVDIDGVVPLPPGCSVLGDPAEAARVVLDVLVAHAPELEGVTAVVQFSTSAALDEMAEGALAASEHTGRRYDWSKVVKPGVSAHVWLWLAAPRGEAELKRWTAKVTAAGLKLDANMTQTVNVHYVAAPVFSAPLRDPLAGRRTVLIEGLQDEAELEVPDRAPPRGKGAEGGAGTNARAGRGLLGHLDAIGPEGFHLPLLRAISAFVAQNWPDPDIDALKEELRTRIWTADPGPRSEREIADRASDRHLDGLIAWAMGQERAKRERLAAEAAAERAARTLMPTFPDRGVPLEAARDQANAFVAKFADRIAAGETTEMGLNVTVGGGKSYAYTQGIAGILAAIRRHAESGEKTLIILAPRHDLNGQLMEDAKKLHPNLKFAVFKGIDWVNPKDPDDAMCWDQELPTAAKRAGQSPTAGCVACSNNGKCPFTAQQPVVAAADVVFAAHNVGFHPKPGCIPKPGAAIFDESFASAGLQGVEEESPIHLFLSTLESQWTGGVTGEDRDRLLLMRERALCALREKQDAGPLLREAGVREGMTVGNLRQWKALEWKTKPEVAITEAMGRDGALEAFRKAAEGGFTPLLPMLANAYLDLFEKELDVSPTAELVRGVSLGKGRGTGDAVRFMWRSDFADWVADLPKLLTDATTKPEVQRLWCPALETLDIEVEAPHRWVRQIVGRAFGREFFTKAEGNVQHLADFVVTELARCDGKVVVITQKAVVNLLRPRLKAMFKGPLPNRLALAHHGAVTGMNDHQDADRIVVVGRPATNRTTGERLAVVAKGGPVEAVVGAENDHWPIVEGAIRMADGSGYPVRQPRHPDALVEAMRWSITEGAVLQAEGRARAVRRTAADRVVVTILSELALPLTVHEVAQWDDAAPSRIEATMALAVAMGWAMPLSATGMTAAFPERWGTKKAAEKELERSDTPQVLIRGMYKRLGGISGYRVAEYRMNPQTRWSLALVPEHEGEAALAEALGAAPYAFRLKDEPPPPKGTAPRPTATAKPPAPAQPPRSPANHEQPRNAEAASAPEPVAEPVVDPEPGSTGLPVEVTSPPPPLLLRRLAERAGGRVLPRVLVLELLPDAATLAPPGACGAPAALVAP